MKVQFRPAIARKRIAALFILIACPFMLKAQSFFFDNYSVKEGLAQSTVFDVIQDNRGYLWMGTSVGVSHFDGIRFKNYTYDDGLANDAVQRIAQDKNGNIWLGHKGGALSRMKNDSVEYFRSDTLSADIISLALDAKGNIWAGTFGDGLIKITNPDVAKLSGLKFTVYTKSKNGFADMVFSITPLRNGSLLFTTSEGLWVLDQSQKNFSRFRHDNLPQFYQFTCAFEDQAGALWFGTDIGGLFKLSPNGMVENFTMKNGLAGNFISFINQDKELNIWVGTWGNGISTISGNTILTLDKKNGLPDLKIRCIRPDLEGNILIGTQENGLLIFKSRRFVNYSEKDGIQGQQVTAVLEDSQKRLWFGTDNGISVFSRDDIYLKDPIYLNQENGKLPDNRIKFLKADRSGNIWVATDQSVLSWSGASGKMDYNFLINGYLSQKNLVTAMEIDNQDNLWIGTINGLIVYEIKSDKVSVLKEKNGLAGNDISTLYADSKGLVWIGCHQKGLTIYNEKEGTFTILKTGIGYTPNCITEAQDKTIWVGTQAQGLLVFNNLDLIRQYRMKDGLYSDLISALVTGQNGDIYIGTSRGLNIIKQNDRQFMRYSEKSGFTGIEVKRNACMADSEGNIWFGTVKGATRIDIRSDYENLSAPPIRINRLRVNMNDRKIGNKLVLNYSENSIVIDYVGICLTDPQSVVYRIMLEGAEDEWQPETSQSTASFSNLAPGKYTFKVIAKNNSGVFNSEPAILTFLIKPPFYRSWTFYIIAAVLTIIIIYIYIKHREKVLIMEKRVLAEKVAERTIEISQKNKELEIKNKNITDSIRYARRIQDALLPDSFTLRSILQNYFIYYAPRDIISGDFFWATKKDKWIIFAVVDCTGHGVPGAFMSLLGINLLDEIVTKKGVIEPDLILNEMRESVIAALRQKGVRGEAQDGMDIALCAIDPENTTMYFSGAYSPCYIVRDGEILSFRGNRMPIGIYYKSTGNFTKHSIQLKDRDMVYLFTDGYADQFGQNKGEKFMNKNFRKVLLEIYQKPLDKQRKFLEDTLKNWKGSLEQVDDILVLGVRINC
jgi:ligand-binding sensor domain-containing protein/serine phosphatase RsbU (regulator of sigma subunit)